ncbi:hypothetical protein SAMN05428948_2716 [Massilia sp. CF038]|nr:hypothetical protein SAMN05428948_2716 [Massilia sp. CF038]
MRKMIMMALAGFVWRQIQTRMNKRAATRTPLRQH